VYLVCGLGNKGYQYRKTRHNTGYLVIEKLSQRLNIPLSKRIHGCPVGVSENVVIAKTWTFMNISGKHVLLLLREFEISPEKLVIVHDDMDLEFGNIKIKWDGGDGGHKGVRSVIESLGTNEFIRLKVGIGRPKDESLEEYVLSPFTEEEGKRLNEVVDRAVDALDTLIREGKEKAMSLYNRRWTR
jgi:PTH1 family peptidyl-tRNA hydrolase